MSNTTTKNMILSQAKLGQASTAGIRQLAYEMSTEDGFTTVKIEVPGVNPADIAVHCDSTSLYIECERGTTSIPIDAGLDTADIDADVKWGLLTLVIPERAPRTVKLRIHDGAPKTKPQGKTLVETV